MAKQSIDVIAVLDQMIRYEEKYPDLKRMGLLFKKSTCMKCDEEFRFPWKPGDCGCLIPLEVTNG